MPVGGGPPAGEKEGDRPHGRQLAGRRQAAKGNFPFIQICEICGAIQTINDTEKRIQMHLEGKIHQGFLKLRTEIETLKIRLEIVQQKIDKEKGKDSNNKEKEK